ncbi:MAG: hypothetical protein WCP20_18160 [Desulfuromonadales bacterium]
MIEPVSGTTPANSSSNALPAAQGTAEAKAPPSAKPIQVDISRLAQKLASDGDTHAQEVSEGGAEKSSETVRGKA